MHIGEYCSEGILAVLCWSVAVRKVNQDASKVINKVGTMP